MPNFPALILRRADRRSSAGLPPDSAVLVPRPRGGAEVGGSSAIRRGADALTLLEVAPPSSGLNPGSLVLGFAVGAMVVGRRRSGIRHR